ncbi:enamine deaminase RidA (YjgF/YER057c/UK114 family) [Chelatococcus asaccharovorans]|uniref:Enamine deaminase RidA (YjgF/YER057c/UK114 family) n=1 Tax=Chelatococcus asaccharovorans TaxID=28210 RepID=A0A2V3UWM9_9HYPH|nr:RidA family protein [Chelatococcus asaccharovorans]PXW65098.1 enamine deaminase RidA (YjgF/YER057c/UK114 family) [Chelatococcus asaccharovorans]
MFPPPVPPACNYLPVVVHRETAWVSDQVAKVDGELRVFGKVGADLDIAIAREQARTCILQGLAQLSAALGSLDRVERILEVMGFVVSAPGFGRQPQVIDGASERLVDIFGEAGRHARSALGISELPRNAPVEIEMVVARRP